MEEIAHNSKINWMKRSPASLVLDLRSVCTALSDVTTITPLLKKGGGDI